MMSVSNVSAGAAASGYYKEEGYYKAGSPEAEKAAQWFGKAAEEAGLTGRVDDARFSELLDGQTPDAKEMGRYVDGERQHRPGLDLTFSASKTASIAALVIGDERITEAHDAAVRAAMTVVEERYIKTRYQIDGEMKTANAEGIIAGIYRHDTSRALDPNLHSHAVIANMARNEKGEYTAIRNEEIYRNQKVITEVYRSDFESRLKEMGIETQRGKYGEVNVAGISKEVVDGFSKRRQEIVQSLEGMGLENNPENAAKATLATRAAKHKEIDRAELRTEWHKEAVEFGLDERLLDRGKIGPEAPAPILRAIRVPAQHPAQDPAEPGRVAGIVAWVKNLIAAPVTKDVKTPETLEAQAVTKAIEHVSERQSVYERSALTAAALRFTSGASLEKIDKEIDRRIDAGALHAKGEYGETLTDQKSVALESSILETWRNSEKASAPDLATTNRVPDLQSALAQEKTLTEGQRAGIVTALTGHGRYVGIQGDAGAGKTYMVKKLTDLAEQRGYEVKGFAPTHQAVGELDALTGEASTLNRVVMSERNHPLRVDNSKAVLLVDESSMMSARDMRSFMDYAERTNAARVVFVGDTKQLDAVSAGQPFAQLQEAGMRTTVMSENIRTEDDNLRDAVDDAARGDVIDAFKKLENHIHTAEDPRAAAAAQYLALASAERGNTRVLTLTNAARAEINDAVRAGLKAEGAIAAESTSINGLSSRSMTDVERSDAGSYAVGDVVQSLVNSSSDGLKKGTLYAVQTIDTESNALTVQNEADGTRHDVPLSKTVAGQNLGASLVVYQPETRELAVGDAVRARITDRQNELVNGERAVVTNTDDGKVGLTTRDGREMAIDARSLGARGLEHDYAATAHSVQGGSVHRVIVAMNAHERLATQKAFYVEISRARYEATLITDNPEALAKNIAENTGVRMTATEAKELGKSETFPEPAVKAVGWAIEHLSERTPVYERPDLLVEAMRRMPGAHIDDIDDEIDRRIDEGSLFASGDSKTTLTDKASVALESSILMTYHASKTKAGVVLQSDGGRDGPAALAKKLSDNRTLSDGQKDAVMTSLTGEGRYVAVQGYAGTGKTTMVDRLSHYAQQSGYEVKGFAPSHVAVHELGKVLESPETLRAVLTEERHYPKHVDNSKTIIIVDEASMIGSKDMRTFMNYAERTNAARVVFVGDTQQQEAVAAGQPFDRLQEAGMRMVVMDDVLRQQNDTLRNTVYDAIRGDIKSAFEKLGENVQQDESPREKAAETYLALSPDERAETRVLTLTNSARDEINQAIREGLRKEGQIEGADLKYVGLATQKMTDAHKVDARSYAPGDIVLSMVNSRDHGLKKDMTYLVRNVDGPRNRITVEHEETGERQFLPLGVMYNKRELGKSLVVYEKEQRELAAGDQVRFRITDKSTGVTNGMRGHVTTTSDGVIEVETREGNTVSFSADALAARGIELDYAATAHAVQGESVDQVIVAMGASEKLATQKAFYVEISRAKDSATLITNDTEKLLKTIEGQTGIRTNALEAWLDSQRADDRDDQKDRASGRDQDAAKSDPDKHKEQEKDEAAIGYLPGLFDEKTEAKLQEMEKQAELIRDKNKEITR
ncbi:MobF family relaxase [uncultured Tateyamaria sp.]|uniref:MobF family relaxase n=1 Tax=uncultured Tateyamaria sp. TaxID=455651 RepID=UPI00260239E0|nr:MobF family relaxase [uncultured Tateyamaria sp.]